MPSNFQRNKCVAQADLWYHRIDYDLNKLIQTKIIKDESVGLDDVMNRTKWNSFWLLLFCLVWFAGCRGQTDPEETTQEETDVQVQADEILHIGYDGGIGSFHPLFAVSDAEQELVHLTQAMLLTVDRSGEIVYDAIYQKELEHNGFAYTYEGIARIDVSYNAKDDITTYHITLRQDASTPEGEPLTADDLLFTLYVLSDPAYTGPYSLARVPIIGMQNYRLEAPADVTVEDAEITQVLQELPEELAEELNRTLVVPVLEEELDWCRSLYESTDYSLLTDQYASPEELFLHFYGQEESYAPEAAGADVVRVVAAEYGGDYGALGRVCGADETTYEEDARQLAEEYLIAEKIASGQRGKAPNISGIRKISAFRVDIDTNGYDEETLYSLDIPVLSLKKYGEESLYAVSENQFGFDREALETILDRVQLPVGAGPYYMTEEEEGQLTFAANPYYYKGEPEIGTISWQPVTEEEKLTLLSEGQLDVVQVQDSQRVLNAIRQENGNDAISGERIYTCLADSASYSYIGMNVDTVNVGGKGDSDPSIALRKALATLFAYERKEAVNAYAGSTYGVLDYPASRIFDIAPGSSEEAYQQAYTRDHQGHEIYEEDMTGEEAEEAMKQAVLDYFKQAGYTVRGQKVIKAPSGGSLTFELCLASDMADMEVCELLAEQAQTHLEELGIHLELTDVETKAALQERLTEGTYELWCGIREDTLYPDLYHTYGSSSLLKEETMQNRYHLEDQTLDSLLTELKKERDPELRDKAYYKCLEEILEQAVEVPVCQCRTCICFSAQTVDVETIPDDMTAFYPWLIEIEKLRLQ